jgi:hypothetical protein
LAEKKDYLPDLSALYPMVQHVVEGIEPFHEGIKCGETGAQIEGPRYYGKKHASRGSDNVVNFSESAMFKVKSCDIDPIVFVRFARPLIDKELVLPDI